MGSVTTAVRGLAVLPVVLAVMSPAASAVPGRSQPPESSWTIAGTDITPESTNVQPTSDGVRVAAGANRAASALRPAPVGVAVFAPHRLDSKATGVSADIDVDVPKGNAVDIDVRERQPDGTWSQWTAVRPGTTVPLDTPSTTLQVRALLTGDGSVLHSIVVHPTNTTPTPGRSGADGADGADGAGLTYRVFATREGLVGHTTANGHHIGGHDHFVALPSRRALGSNRSGEYTVRVCANKRCEWAPVWDIGPWNTTDDHWSATGRRQSWADLPQGTPEAQAAYRGGYHKGKDQYGRKVTNPAGIDLADGTFSNGLKLAGNSVVTVTYQWTGRGAVGTVRTGGIPLNVRSGPAAGRPQVGLAADKAQVRVECRVTGQAVGGTLGTSKVWYRLAAGMFVAAAYVSVSSSAPAC